MAGETFWLSELAALPILKHLDFCETTGGIIKKQDPRLYTEFEALLLRHRVLLGDVDLHTVVMDIALAPFPEGCHTVLTPDRFWGYTPFQCQLAADHFTKKDPFVFDRERLVDGLARLRNRCAAVDAASLHDRETTDPFIGAYLFVMRMLAYAWESWCRGDSARSKARSPRPTGRKFG